MVKRTVPDPESESGSEKSPDHNTLLRTFGVSPEFLKFAGLLIGADYASMLISAEIERQRTRAFLEVTMYSLDLPADSVRIYADVLGRFVSFLKTGQRARSCTDSEFESYRALIKSLVDTGDLRPRALRHWPPDPDTDSSTHR